MGWRRIRWRYLREGMNHLREEEGEENICQPMIVVEITGWLGRNRRWVTKEKRTQGPVMIHRIRRRFGDDSRM